MAAGTIDHSVPNRDVVRARGERYAATYSAFFDRLRFATNDHETLGAVAHFAAIAVTDPGLFPRPVPTTIMGALSAYAFQQTRYSCGNADRAVRLSRWMVTSPAANGTLESLAVRT